MVAHTDGVLKVQGETFMSDELHAVVAYDRDALRISVGNSTS
jgi:hypothetical protein